jgi:GNAT superfamily N-acetyltransferase
MSVTVSPATQGDIAVMAAIRASEWQTKEYWATRIRAYLAGESSPGQAQPGRAAFVAAENEEIVGFVAGHLTKRLKCHGELQWINVVAEKRGQGIAGLLIENIANWFVAQGAVRVCVDPDAAARGLYQKFGATALNRHWMVWEDSRQMLRRAMEVNRSD